jgi:outer membrane protein
VKPLLLIALSLAALTAQTPLTLEQAERLAVTGSPEVAASLLNAAAANQVTLEVHSAALPLALANFTGVSALRGSQLAAGALSNSSVLDRFAGGVTASQLISDFGRIGALTASSRYRALARGEAARATQALIVLQADRAYFAVLRAQSVLRVAQQTVGSRQTVSDQITALGAVQLKSGLDVSFAQVNLSEAKLLLVNAESDVDAAQAELAAALGLRERRQFVLQDLPGEVAPPPDPTPLVRNSLAFRPELLSLRADQAAAEQYTVAEHDLRKPTISAVGAAGYIPLRDNVLRSRYAAAGINLNIPIFNGHLFRAREAEAELRAREAAQNVKVQENRISRDVQIAFLNAAAAYRRIDLTAELAIQAAKGLELAQARYDLGLSSIVELSQAQLSKTSADIANSTAKYDYRLQRAVLDYQTASAK